MSFMSDFIFAEDSTITKLAPSLESILRDLKENVTHHDYLVALLIVFLAEYGFQVSTSDVCDSQRLNLRSLRIPENWKSKDTKAYDMRFHFVAAPNVTCKLVAVPSGDLLIVNFYPLIDRGKTYSICVQSLKYINPFSSDLCGRYRNLKEISLRFKDSLANPVRIDVATREGIVVPSLQSLPIELKIRIMNLLNPHDLSQLIEVLARLS
nr:uncharacterized protein LOC117220795 [Megalopta genalis]